MLWHCVLIGQYLPWWCAQAETTNWHHIVIVRQLFPHLLHPETVIPTDRDEDYSMAMALTWSHSTSVYTPWSNEGCLHMEGKRILPGGHTHWWSPSLLWTYPSLHVQCKNQQRWEVCNENICVDWRKADWLTQTKQILLLPFLWLNMQTHLLPTRMLILTSLLFLPSSLIHFSHIL